MKYNNTTHGRKFKYLELKTLFGFDGMF